MRHTNTIRDIVVSALLLALASPTLRAKNINETMWNDITGFYYDVDKKTHAFTHKGQTI